MFKMIKKLFSKMFRIAYNEIDSVLDKMESLEKSLRNALVERKEKYAQYKKNCASIFAFESELLSDLSVEEKAVEEIRELIHQHKLKYEKNSTEELKDNIMFLLGKQQHHEEKRDTLKVSLAQQVVQNKNVTMNLRDEESKISDLEQKVGYIQTQIKIAKNKELITNLGDRSDSVYDINEIFSRVQRYIAEVDGKERVADITGENDRMMIEAKSSIKNAKLETRFEELMNGGKK